jgi:CBS domain-containing protein
MKVRELMSSPPIFVKRDTSVARIAQLLIDNRISGVPVVDDDMQVVGIVTEADLFLKEEQVPFSLVRATTLLSKWAPPESLEEIRLDVERSTAAEVMTANVICADVEDKVADVARNMVQNDVKRIPVLENGRLAGMLTRYDVIRQMARRRD